MSDNSADNNINKPVVEKKAAKKKKGGIAATIEKIVLVIGFGIFIGSIFLPPAFRDAMSSTVNTIVSPISATMPFYIAVLVIATIVTVFSSIIQKYTMDWALFRRVQENSQSFQKKFREAQLAGDKKKLKQLEESRMGMMEDQAEMSKQQLKPMGFIVFVSIPLFWWAYWYLSQPANHAMTMIWPLLNNNMPIPLTNNLLIFPYWVVWSLMCSLAISSVIRKALNIGVM
jgi:uncharacterized membrane protein (DUF106 family)